MGNICKPDKQHSNSKSKRLYQLKHEAIGDITIKANGHSSKSNESKPNQKVVSLIMVDCEDERVFDKEANLRVISNLKGYSQINYNDSLYLCGSNNQSVCSFLLHIDLKNSNDIEILINSQYPHKYPSLAVIEGQSLGQASTDTQAKSLSILVVGGLNQLGCESYEISSSRWTKMPELPEERYHCTLMPNQQKTHVFLFGGFSSETSSNSNTILRLNISSPLVWERLLIKENPELLCRHSCACIYNKLNNTFILVGGVDNAKEAGSMIIEFNPLTRIASQSLTNRLHTKAKFRNQSGYEINSNSYSLIDSTGSIHKIDMSEATMLIKEF